MERLSSGLRINGAADDAAGMAVANKMQSQLKGIKMAFVTLRTVSLLSRLLRVAWARSQT